MRVRDLLTMNAGHGDEMKWREAEHWAKEFLAHPVPHKTGTHFRFNSPATSKQVPNGSDPNSDWNQGYGFQFWQCRHGAYRGDGKDGQFCIVMPAELNLVWDKSLSRLMIRYAERSPRLRGTSITLIFRQLQGIQMLFSPNQ